MAAKKASLHICTVICKFHIFISKFRIFFQDGKTRDARYRIRDNYLLVDVKVPQDGQYGLDIFAREKWDDQMVHCCKYLINCDV